MTTVLHYDLDPDDKPAAGPRLSLDTSSLEWLYSLTKLEQSEPDWVRQDILTVSPSMLAQEHFESLCRMGGSAPTFDLVSHSLCARQV
jgi:hypothetical protein